MSIDLFPVDMNISYPKILTVSVNQKDNEDYILWMTVIDEDGTQRPVGFRGTSDSLKLLSRAVQHRIP